jgi:hypothetical protein
LSGSIDSERTRASGAEGTLAGSIDSERTRASEAEGTLAGSIGTLNTAAGTLSGSIDSERTRASGAEGTLAGSIDSERTRASGAEGTLSGSIDSERTRASGAEGTLSGSIDSERTRASGAEGTLSGSIDSERTRASGAEGTLSSSLNSLVYGTSTFYNLLTVTGANASIKVNGKVHGTVFCADSDIRLKTDIEDITNGLVTVRALHPVFYNWNNGHVAINPGHKELGFLAQEVEAVLPNIVSTDNSNEFAKKAVAYDRVVSLLVAAVKELDARVTALEPSV